MKRIQGSENLSKAERKLFIAAHNKHLILLKDAERNQYGLEMSPNSQDSAISVQILNGEQLYRHWLT